MLLLPFFCPTLSAFVLACVSTYPTHLVNSWNLCNEKCPKYEHPWWIPSMWRSLRTPFLLLQLRHESAIMSEKIRFSRTEWNLHTPAWSAWSIKDQTQRALAPLCFQSDVRVTSCEVTQGVFSFICASHQLDNSDGGASSPSPWLGEAPSKWRCHLRPNPVKTLQDPALKCHPFGVKSMNTVTVRCSTYFGSSAEDLQSWQRLCLKGHVGPKFGCRINTD